MRREKRAERNYRKKQAGAVIALLLFVGIPLPGTGAWTGTLAASILDMDFKINNYRRHARGSACRNYYDGAQCGRIRHVFEITKEVINQ